MLLLERRAENLLGAWVVLRPNSDKLVQVMSSQNGGIACQVIEVVHDDSHEKIEHEEGTEEDKGDEIKVRNLRPTRLVGGQAFSCNMIIIIFCTTRRTTLISIAYQLFHCTCANEDHRVFLLRKIT